MLQTYVANKRLMYAVKSVIVYMNRLSGNKKIILKIEKIWKNWEILDVPGFRFASS
jgi:hypothetical protein